MRNSIHKDGRWVATSTLPSPISSQHPVLSFLFLILFHDFPFQRASTSLLPQKTKPQTSGASSLFRPQLGLGLFRALCTLSGTSLKSPLQRHVHESNAYLRADMLALNLLMANIALRASTYLHTMPYLQSFSSFSLSPSGEVRMDYMRERLWLWHYSLCWNAPSWSRLNDVMSQGEEDERGEGFRGRG